MTDAEAKRVIRAIGFITSVNEIDLTAKTALEQLQRKLQQAVDELNKLEIIHPTGKTLEELTLEIATAMIAEHPTMLPKEVVKFAKAQAEEFQKLFHALSKK